MSQVPDLSPPEPVYNPLVGGPPYAPRSMVANLSKDSFLINDVADAKTVPRGKLRLAGWLFRPKTASVRPDTCDTEPNSVVSEGEVPKENGSPAATIWDTLPLDQSNRCYCIPKSKRVRILLSLFILALVLAIVMILLVVIVVPRVAQWSLSHAQLHLEHVSLDAPQNSTFQMGLQARLTETGHFSVYLQPMPMTVSYKQRVIGTFTLPAMHITAGSETKMVLQDMTFSIASQEAFLQFSTDTLNEKYLTWSLSGEATVNIDLLGGLEVSRLIFAKTVTLAGMAGLTQLEVKHFDLNSASKAGVAMRIATRLFNPSIVAISLGTPHFEVFYDRALTVRVAASNMRLIPGWNEIEMRGDLLRVTPSEHHRLKAYNDFFSAYLRGKSLEVLVTGAASSTQGIEWLDVSLRQLAMLTTIPGSKIKVIQKLKMDKISLLTDPNKPQSLKIHADIEASYSLPFSMSVNMISMTSSLMLFDGNATSSMQPMAYLQSPSSYCRTNSSAQVVRTSIKGVMDVAYANHFEKFMTSLLLESNRRMNLTGFVNVRIRTDAGLFDLHDIAVQDDIVLSGLQQFRTIPPKVQDIVMVRGVPGALTMRLSASLMNPSDLTLQLGRIELKVEVEKSFIGKAVIDQMKLVPGENQMMAVVTVNLPAQGSSDSRRDIVTRFLSQYVNGLDQKAALVGSLSSTPVLCLAGSLRHLRLETVVPGMSRDKRVVIRSNVGFKYRNDDQKRRTIPTTGAQFFMKNPFDIPLAIYSMSQVRILMMNVTVDDLTKGNFGFDEDFSLMPQVATMDEPTLMPPFLIEPNSVYHPGSRWVRLHVPTLVDVTAARRLLANQLVVAIESLLDVTLGDFSIQVVYKQTSIPVKLLLSEAEGDWVHRWSQTAMTFGGSFLPQWS